MNRVIPKPQSGEYPAYAHIYMDLIPDDGRLFQHFTDSLEATRTLVRTIPLARLVHRYAAGKWTIKEILGHLIDDERIYVYRALRFARNDSTELPGFEQDSFAAYSEANDRHPDDLLDELTDVRQATIAFFRSLSETALMRSGVADGNRATVRALAYHIVGHHLRHLNMIRERYL